VSKDRETLDQYDNLSHYAALHFGEDECMGEFTNPEAFHDGDEWRVSRLFNVWSFVLGMYKANKLDSHYLHRHIKRVIDHKGYLTVEWAKEPTAHQRSFFNHAWASNIGDVVWLGACNDVRADAYNNVEHKLVLDDNTKMRRAERGNGLYTLDQLRGAWGAGFHAGQEVQP